MAQALGHAYVEHTMSQLQIGINTHTHTHRDVGTKLVLASSVSGRGFAPQWYQGLVAMATDQHLAAVAWQ